jgi:hypothetical protein
MRWSHCRFLYLPLTSPRSDDESIFLLTASLPVDLQTIPDLTTSAQLVSTLTPLNVLRNDVFQQWSCDLVAKMTTIFINNQPLCRCFHRIQWCSSCLIVGSWPRTLLSERVAACWCFSTSIMWFSTIYKSNHNICQTINLNAAVLLGSSCLIVGCLPRAR